MQIEGVGALVTGGASGLGEATVRELIAHGATVTIADKNADRGKALASELGGNCRFAEMDVTDSASVEAAIAHAADGTALRIVSHAAGLGWAQRTINRDNSPHDFDPFMFVINVNLIGTFNVLRFGASAMAKTEPYNADGARGVVVNTASAAAFDGQIGQLAYSASKGGVVGMTLPAARDLAAVGIRVCTIAPGTFDTPLMAMAGDDTKAGLAASIPFPKRMGNPSEYAQLVRHIAENDYLNGETIRLDGAVRMPPK
jgi:NAD(P)-dependent dehydrogenase (short-subunit alcohol dehydrogenase family)